MTLEEAKKKLDDMKWFLTGDGVETIDTILKALEEYEKQLDLDYVEKNYVSKEYHEMVVKEQNDIIEDLKEKNKKLEEENKYLQDYLEGMEGGLKEQIKEQQKQISELQAEMKK